MGESLNGWFMCLIPTEVLRTRSGCRCRCSSSGTTPSSASARQGRPATRRSRCPGAAVWHVPWTDKNDALDWQSYFHQRNRIDRGAAALAVRARRPDGPGEPQPPGQAPGLDAVLHRRAAAPRARGRARRSGAAARRRCPPARRAAARMRKQYADAQLQPTPTRSRRCGARSRRARARTAPTIPGRLAPAGHRRPPRGPAGRAPRAIARRESPGGRAAGDGRQVVPHGRATTPRSSRCPTAPARRWYQRDPERVPGPAASAPSRSTSGCYREWPRAGRSATATRCGDDHLAGGRGSKTLPRRGRTGADREERSDDRADRAVDGTRAVRRADAPLTPPSATAACSSVFRRRYLLRLLVRREISARYQGSFLGPAVVLHQPADRSSSSTTS